MTTPDTYPFPTEQHLSFDGNTEMEMAHAFVRDTGANIFLTGKAGTGKTTFLKYLKENCHKQIMVTAPTGVAAINAGGVTLHSFFQLPFGPYLPGRVDQSRDNKRFFRFSKEKKRIIKGLDILVIDEISMVRSDLLDSVDAVLKRLRRDERPFGGVQLLLIGDLFQLPPVALPNEWNLLQEYYESVYFFSSHALAQTQLLTIELKTVYRQSDESFINLLNAVRSNQLDNALLDLLNQRVQENVPDQGYITLTTHNKKAEAINNKRMAQLSEAEHTLYAEISGDFPEQSFPTPDNLILKPGAQVMFLRNDPSPEKAFYNGKIGTIDRIKNDKVIVSCQKEEDGYAGAAIEVSPVEWENITYKVDETDQTIKEEVVGRFKQYPLKPAWAVTIHKSQGLTFDKAVVDSQDAFTHGQTYVALSRCRSLDGLVLASPVPKNTMGVDQAVSVFMDRAVNANDLKPAFLKARISYQQDLLLRCFDCSGFKGLFYYFIRLAENNLEVVRISGLKDIPALKAGALNQIFGVSDKFQAQLKGLMDQENLPETNDSIMDRTQKASAWFTEQFDKVFGELLEKGEVETDNKTLGKQVKNAVENLKQEIRIKQAGIASCAGGFSAEGYLKALSQAAMTALPKAALKKLVSPDYTEFDIAHPDLFKALKNWRAKIAKAEGVPHFHVLHQKVLVQIAVCLPESKPKLAELKGVGPKTIEKYGEDLVSIVEDYRKEANISEVVLPDPKPIPEQSEKKETKKTKKSGPNTREISLSMFEKGMAVEEIAEERGLVLSTIQGHLCHFIEQGRLSVNVLVDDEKHKAIKGNITPGKSLAQLKKELGNDFFYGEIRAVLAHQVFLESGKE